MSRSPIPMIRWVGLSLALALALTGCGKGCAKKETAKGSMQLIPADRNVLVAMNWKKIESSPLGAKIKEGMPPDVAPLIQDIDRVLIGLHIQDAGPKDPNFLAIVSGKLDSAKLIEEMNKQAQKDGVTLSSEDYEGVKIHSTSKSPEVGAAFLDGKGLVGNKDALKKAIDLTKKKGESIESNKMVMDLVGGVDKEKMLWAVGTIPPGAIPGAGGPPQPGNPMGALQSLKAVDLAMDYGDNFMLDVGLVAGNAEDAKQLATMANSYKTLFGGSLAQKDPAFGKLLNGLAIDAKGEKVLLSLKLDKATVDELAKLAPAAAMGAGAPGGPPPMDMGAPPAPEAFPPGPAPVAPAPVAPPAPEVPVAPAPPAPPPGGTAVAP